MKRKENQVHLVNAEILPDGSISADEVSQVVHGVPVIKKRPEKYERYDEYGLSENGEMLYVKRALVDEKSYAMYCPACGKRLCSRFINYCPNCGAKMDKEAYHED